MNLLKLCTVKPVFIDTSVSFQDNPWSLSILSSECPLKTGFTVSAKIIPQKWYAFNFFFRHYEHCTYLGLSMFPPYECVTSPLMLRCALDLDVMIKSSSLSSSSLSMTFTFSRRPLLFTFLLLIGWGSGVVSRVLKAWWMTENSTLWIIVPSSRSKNFFHIYFYLKIS